jgi:hypothetical protein
MEDEIDRACSIHGADKKFNNVKVVNGLIWLTLETSDGLL